MYIHLYGGIFFLLFIAMYVCAYVCSVADLGGFLGFHGTPLWAGPSILKVMMINQMEPPSLANRYEGCHP